MSPAPGAASFAAVLAGRGMCRDFLADPVAPDVLRRVLDAAFRGPAAGNTHALDLVVLEGDETARHWDAALPAGDRPSFRWPGLLRAPVLVEVLVDPDAYVKRYALRDKERTGLGRGPEAWDVPYWFVDGGAAVMAMLLAAQAEGLGALLFGLFDHERAVLDALGVPPGRRSVGALALGWAAPGGRRPSASAVRGRPDPGDHIRPGRW